MIEYCRKRVVWNLHTTFSTCISLKGALRILMYIFDINNKWHNEGKWFDQGIVGLSLKNSKFVLK